MSGAGEACLAGWRFVPGSCHCKRHLGLEFRCKGGMGKGVCYVTSGREKSSRLE
jgi:hypothetical protein